MSSIELSFGQKRILQALIRLYTDSEESIKSEDIAELVDSKSWSIRNQMGSLTSLKLVEGVPGPKGGYKPTATAYEVLENHHMDEPASTSLQRGGEDAKDVIVEKIGLASLHPSKHCRAEIQFQGSIDSFQEAEEVTIGPTPLMKLRISGTVDSKDKTNNSLILRINTMIAPATPLD